MYLPLDPTPRFTPKPVYDTPPAVTSTSIWLQLRTLAAGAARRRQANGPRSTACDYVVLTRTDGLVPPR